MDQAKQSGNSCKKQRIERPRPEQGKHGTVVSEREAKVAFPDRIQPLEIAHRKRPIEPVLCPQGCHGLQRHLWVQTHFIHEVAGREIQE